MKERETSAIRAVVFDVDGVLVDSLDAHLRICRDKAREFGLALEIPTAEGIRQMLKRGVSISPMECFFRAVGMPQEEAARANADYRREFMVKYRPRPFPGVRDLLRELSQRKVLLGIATSNTLANVRASLGDLFEYFDDELVFDRDAAASKEMALRLASARLGEGAAKLLYVGDQPADRHAAAAAGTRFLGVSYGWGFDEHEPEITTVGSPEAIARFVASA